MSQSVDLRLLQIQNVFKCIMVKRIVYFQNNDNDKKKKKKTSKPPLVDVGLQAEKLEAHEKDNHNNVA